MLHSSFNQPDASTWQPTILHDTVVDCFSSLSPTNSCFLDSMVDEAWTGTLECSSPSQSTHTAGDTNIISTGSADPRRLSNQTFEAEMAAALGVDIPPSFQPVASHTGVSPLTDGFHAFGTTHALEEAVSAVEQPKNQVIQQSLPKDFQSQTLSRLMPVIGFCEKEAPTQGPLDIQQQRIPHSLSSVTDSQSFARPHEYQVATHYIQQQQAPSNESSRGSPKVLNITPQQLPDNANTTELQVQYNHSSNYRAAACHAHSTGDGLRKGKRGGKRSATSLSMERRSSAPLPATCTVNLARVHRRLSDKVPRGSPMSPLVTSGGKRTTQVLFGCTYPGCQEQLSLSELHAHITAHRNVSNS